MRRRAATSGEQLPQRAPGDEACRDAGRRPRLVLRRSTPRSARRRGQGLPRVCTPKAPGRAPAGDNFRGTATSACAGAEPCAVSFARRRTRACAGGRQLPGNSYRSGRPGTRRVPRMHAAGHASSAAGPQLAGHAAWPRHAPRLHAEGPGECPCVMWGRLRDHRRSNSPGRTSSGTPPSSPPLPCGAALRSRQDDTTQGTARFPLDVHNQEPLVYSLISRIVSLEDLLREGDELLDLSEFDRLFAFESREVIVDKSSVPIAVEALFDLGDPLKPGVDVPSVLTYPFVFRWRSSFQVPQQGLECRLTHVVESSNKRQRASIASRDPQ